MCGIAGFYNIGVGEAEGRAVLRAMCDAIRHRGPDDDGYFWQDQVGMGMRRLSIIDLAGGHQPISNDRNTRHIVFNGEIYNFRELREILAGQGHRFRTHCDTEVILRQFEQDGPACVNRFNGMFAFSIWDSEKRQLFIARDRLGVKPLYYYWDGRSFLYGSEIKAILASGRVAKDVNEEAVWDYLTFRYIPQPNSIWKRIHKLEPGHTLTISQDDPEPRIRRYWDIPSEGSGAKKSFREYQEEFEGLYLDAVRLRLIADVPVGILLSGGLDSSAVAAAVSEVHNSKVSSFSIAFKDSPSTNELPFAREVADRIGTDHHEVLIGQKEFMDFLPDFVWHSDEPVADLASVPLHYVSKLARGKVKVVLSGEGADEVLGGYNFDKMVSIWEKIRRFQRIPAWLRFGILQPLAGAVNDRLAERLRVANEPLGHRMVSHPHTMTNYMTSSEKAPLFGNSRNGFGDSLDVLRRDSRRVDIRDPLQHSLFMFCQSWLVEDLLMKADKMTMANSIELRVPFLDYRLVEWAAKAPSMVKVGRNSLGKLETKRILREFARTRLPSSILERPKQGFPVPVYEWLNGDLKPWVEDKLLSKSNWINQFFDPKEVEASLRKWQRGGDGNADRHRIWNLLILQIWAEKWI
jgi:asparagine synthase (glutamine-hydrolysing)